MRPCLGLSQRLGHAALQASRAPAGLLLAVLGQDGLARQQQLDLRTAASQQHLSADAPKRSPPQPRAQAGTATGGHRPAGSRAGCSQGAHVVLKLERVVLRAKAPDGLPVAVDQELDLHGRHSVLSGMHPSTFEG